MTADVLAVLARLAGLRHALVHDIPLTADDRAELFCAVIAAEAFLTWIPELLPLPQRQVLRGRMADHFRQACDEQFQEADDDN